MATNSPPVYQPFSKFQEFATCIEDFNRFNEDPQHPGAQDLITRIQNLIESLNMSPYETDPTYIRELKQCISTIHKIESQNRESEKVTCCCFRGVFYA